MKLKLLLIDHHDSFSNNLKAALHCSGFEVELVQSSELDKYIWCWSYPWHAVVFSPGPGSPVDYPQSLAFYRQLNPAVAVLGVCLGHQLMLSASGANAVETRAIPLHGRQVQIQLPNSRLLDFEAHIKPTRHNFVLYNSLEIKVTEPIFEKNWVCLASDKDTVLMAEHRFLPHLTVQFHPESFASPGGGLFFKSFAKFVKERVICE